MEHEPQQSDSYTVRFIADLSEAGEGAILVPVEADDTERLISEQTVSFLKVAEAAHRSGLGGDSYYYDVGRAMNRLEASGSTELSAWADPADDMVYYVLSNPDQANGQEAA